MNLNPEYVAALKTATQLLIARVGGLVAAASVCRLESPRLSICQSHTHPEATLPIDVVLALEAVAGDPIVTRVLARALGLTLVQPDAAPGADIGRAVAAVTMAAASAGATFMQAHDDGVIDATEEATVRRHLEQVREDADKAIAALGGAAPKLRAVS